MWSYDTDKHFGLPDEQCMSLLYEGGRKRPFKCAPTNGKLNIREAEKGWKQLPFRAKGLTSEWKHFGGQ
jgi:hypothetical protein